MRQMCTKTCEFHPASLIQVNNRQKDNASFVFNLRRAALIIPPASRLSLNYIHVQSRLRHDDTRTRYDTRLKGNHSNQPIVTVNTLTTTLRFTGFASFTSFVSLHHLHQFLQFQQLRFYR
ncbi:Protein of unknown function [Pyronema omphalodes CBS 100304]|uniref:Uncharacterized protein n=1 Tax=Pyronema omphalodes (strain CBS 100304) TaxID=1076935 RepID=U4L3F3_PYROM|nr:Protein of unknown function [Pyronema omphalodes CBS 100304]